LPVVVPLEEDGRHAVGGHCGVRAGHSMPRPGVHVRHTPGPWPGNSQSGVHGGQYDVIEVSVPGRKSRERRDARADLEPDGDRQSTATGLPRGRARARSKSRQYCACTANNNSHGAMLVLLCMISVSVYPGVNRPPSGCALGHLRNNCEH
jgi:hypothetical protein